MIPFPVYLFVLIELIAVSYGDIKTNKIPNFWSLLNLVAFFVLLWVAPQYYHFGFQTFFYSTVFLVVGFVLFLLNIMGGGDSKFLFTFFLLLPVSLHRATFHNLLLSTILIGGAFFLHNVLKNLKTLFKAFMSQDLKTVKSCFGTKFSYAPVILVAWLLMGWTLRDKF
ncbi:MAG: prepilin peptidase [Bacteriovoracaceae bacterium]